MAALEKESPARDEKCHPRVHSANSVLAGHCQRVISRPHRRRDVDCSLKGQIAPEASGVVTAVGAPVALPERLALTRRRTQLFSRRLRLNPILLFFFSCQVAAPDTSLSPSSSASLTTCNLRDRPTDKSKSKLACKIANSLALLCSLLQASQLCLCVSVDKTKNAHSNCARRATDWPCLLLASKRVHFFSSSSVASSCVFSSGDCM